MGESGRLLSTGKAKDDMELMCGIDLPKVGNEKAGAMEKNLTRSISLVLPLCVITGKPDVKQN